MPGALSPDDLQELKDLRSVFDYSAELKRLEDYGKWVFAAVTTIAALGAGLSSTAFKVLTSSGKLLFAIAIILTGLSLASAAMLLAPQWLTVNRWSRDSMRNALNLQFEHRRKYTVIAGLCLALALVLAGMSPAISGLFPDKPVVSKLSYAFSKGTLETGLSLSGVAPDSDAVLELVRLENEKTVPVARVMMHADASGSATRTLQVAAAPGTYKLSYSCKGADGKDCPSRPELITVTGASEKLETAGGATPPGSEPAPKANAKSKVRKNDFQSSNRHRLRLHSQRDRQSRSD